MFLLLHRSFECVMTISPRNAMFPEGVHLLKNVQFCYHAVMKTASGVVNVRRFYLLLYVIALRTL